MSYPQKEKVVRVTKSPCPSCRTMVRAEMVLRNGSLFLRKHCPDDGTAEVLYRRDFKFYSNLCKIAHCVDKSDDSSRNGFGRIDRDMIGIIGIDLTDRCNLRCPVCLSDAGEDGTHHPTLEEILRRLGSWNGRRPVIYLMGGEPTMREDLPEIIQEIRSRGFTIVLLTNGLKLADRSFAENLREKGLTFVSVQFDGLSDDIYRKMRGKKLLDIKMAALKNLEELEFKTSFSVVMIKGINDHQIGDIARLAIEMKSVVEVDFLPARQLGRDTLGLEDHKIEISELMELLDAGTGGRIRQKDFLLSMKAMNALYRITGADYFKQRLCRFTLPVIGEPDSFYPALRLANPLHLLGNHKSIRALKFMSGNLLKIYHKRELPKDITFVSITDFYDFKTLNTTDTSLCNAAYMTKNGYIPGCVYNTLFRKNCLV